MGTASETPLASVERHYRVPPTGLTVRQREFVRLYLLKGAAYPAYLQAFSVTDPRDLTNARAYAYRLLKTVEVRQFIRDSTESVRKRLRVDVGLLLQEAVAVARSSVGDYYDFDQEGFPVTKPARDIDALAQRAIKSITRTDRTITHRHPDGTVTQETRVTSEFELHDKMRALQLMFRHLGLDNPVNPLEALIMALPLELQHRVADVLRTTFRSTKKSSQPPVSKVN